MDNCPHCQALLTADLASDSCPDCGKPLVDRTVVKPKAPQDGPIEATRTIPSEPAPKSAPTEEIEGTIVKPRGAAAPVNIEPPGDPLIGEVLGGCKLTKRLGQGAMGAVYEATQINLERTVAVKTIRPEYVSDEGVLKRFQQEAKTVGRFSTPHVVQIHQVGYQHGIHFIVMEYVDGGDLRGFVDARPSRRLETDEALRFLREGSLGLKEAQEAGVLHRDIKPDNLLLTGKGVLKVADFGIAKMLDADVQMTRTSELTGTPLYMSPEQCKGEELDFRSDMYSLGACFFYLITGQPPAKGNTVYELLQTKTRMKNLSPERALPNVKVSGPLSRVIEKMTAQDRADRYESYDALIADLDRVDAGVEPIGKIPARSAARAPQGAEDTTRIEKPEATQGRRSPLPMVAVVLLVLGGGGYAGYEFYLKPKSAAAKTGDADKTEKVAAKQPETKQPEVDPEKTTPENEEAKAADANPTDVKPVTEPPKKVPTPVPTLPSAAEFLAKLEAPRSEFRKNGPSGSVRTTIQELFKSVPEAMPAVRTQITALLNDVDEAKRIREGLDRNLELLQLELPFQDLENYRQTIVKVTTPPAGAGPELQAWAAERQKTRLASKKLETLARETLEAGWRACAAANVADLDKTGLAAAKSQLATVRDGAARFTKIYPGLEGFVASLIPPTASKELETKIVGRTESLGLVQELLDAVKALSLVRSYSSWRIKKQGLLEEGQRLADRTKKWQAAYPTADTDVAESQQAYERQLKNWRDLDALAEKIGDAFADRELASIARLARGTDVEEFTLAVEAARHLEKGFELVFGELSLSAAGEEFATAHKKLQDLGAPFDKGASYADRCKAAVAALERASSGMLRVKGGKVNAADTGLTAVQAFFMDATECSREKYFAFLKRVFAKRKDYEAANAEFGKVWPTERDFRDTWNDFPDYENSRVDPMHPADRVTYYSAKACAYGMGKHRDLPTLQEWWLAAHGPQDKHIEFPWGNDWAPKGKPDLRNYGAHFMKVADGGFSKQFQRTNQKAHHLGGNAAEWLSSGIRGLNGKLVGCACYDNGRVSRENIRRLYSGRLLNDARLTVRKEGYGFRTVLRPANFFTGLMPAQ